MPSLMQWQPAARFQLYFLLFSLSFAPLVVGDGRPIGHLDRQFSAGRTSEPADRVHLQGSLRTAQSEAFAVHEILAPTGIVVREYVSASGKVFAVTWHGPWPSDMRQIWPTISSST